VTLLAEPPVSSQSDSARWPVDSPVAAFAFRRSPLGGIVCRYVSLQSKILWVGRYAQSSRHAGALSLGVPDQMNTVFVTMAAALTMMGVVYGVWVGVHSLAVDRLGPRKLGCKGPARDEHGNAVCCTTGKACTGEGRSRRA